MSGFHVFSQTFNKFGVRLGEIVLFGRIGVEVVKFERAIGILPCIHPESFPAAGTDSLATASHRQFPVKKFVLLLCDKVSAQDRYKGNTIGLWAVGICQLSKCRHDILEGGYMCADLIRTNLSGPPSDKGNANAGFIKRAFCPAQLACTVKEIGIGRIFILGAIIAGQYDQSLFVDIEFFQTCDDFPDGIIESAYHGGPSSHWARPVFFGIDTKVRPFVATSEGVAGIFFKMFAAIAVGGIVQMWDLERQVEKKRLISISIDEFDGFLKAKIVGIVSSSDCHTVFD